MIVREILQDPSLIERFDFFNDAENTLGWLRRIDTPEAREVETKLRAAFEQYKVDWINRCRKERPDLYKQQ
jgi:hypothetical protein